MGNGQYDVPTALTPNELKKGLFSDADSDSSQASIGSSVKLAATFDRRVSRRHAVDSKIENYLKIDINPIHGGVKCKAIADRTKAVPAPPEWKLHKYNDPNLMKHLGVMAIKELIGANMTALYNIQDRPRDIHRTILISSIAVDGLDFDATRKPKLILRCLKDGAMSAIAFFKSNYILKQKIHEIRQKKQYYKSKANKPPLYVVDDASNPSHGSQDSADASELRILREDLIKKQ